MRLRPGAHQAWSVLVPLAQCGGISLDLVPGQRGRDGSLAGGHRPGAWHQRGDLRAWVLLAGPLLYFCLLHMVFASSMRTGFRPRCRRWGWRRWGSCDGAGRDAPAVALPYA